MYSTKRRRTPVSCMSLSLSLDKALLTPSGRPMTRRYGLTKCSYIITTPQLNMFTYQLRIIIFIVLNLLLARHFSLLLSQTSPSSLPAISLNSPSPGLCKTEIFTEMHASSRITHAYNGICLAVCGRTASEGAKTLIHAAVGDNSGGEMDGAYLSECRIGKPSRFVRGTESERIEKRLWVC